MNTINHNKQENESVSHHEVDDDSQKSEQELLIVSVPELGGVKGPEPTRFGDWEKNGRCIDF